MNVLDLSFCKILKKAVKQGFQINTAHTIQETLDNIEKYLLKITPIQVLKHCPIQTVGNAVFVYYSFKQDCYFRNNVIVDESYSIFEDNKLIHSEFINSRGQHVGLYSIVEQK